eukprot:2213544-Rhodomonas_salina.1
MSRSGAARLGLSLEMRSWVRSERGSAAQSLCTSISPSSCPHESWAQESCATMPRASAACMRSAHTH